MITVILATLSTSIVAQSSKITSADVRLKKAEPNVYISLERQGAWQPIKRSESKSRVWLRLHNNSKWDILTCMWDIPKVYGDKDIPYEVETIDRLSRNKLPTMTNREDSCGMEFIESGKSVVFSIPREHLSDGLAIKVQFRYEWEIDDDGFINDEEPRHFAYFYSSGLREK